MTIKQQAQQINAKHTALEATQPGQTHGPAALLEANDGGADPYVLRGAPAAMPDEDAEALARIEWLETCADQYQDMLDYRATVGIY